MAGGATWNLVATVTFYISLIFSKISVAALFLRILGQTRTVRKTAFLYSMMALATIIGFIGAGYCTGQCSPIAKDWRHSIPGKCHGNISLKIGVAQGAINAFIDFALAFFPITFLLNSSINARKKAVIWLLMSCGMVAGVCSIARVVVSTVRNDSGDFTYVETIHTYLAISEEGVSIVLACLPTLLPLGRLIRDRTCFRRHGTNRQTTKNSTSWPSERKRSYPSPDPYAMDMEDYTAVKSATTIQKTSTFGVTFGSEVDLIQAIGDGRRTDVRGGEIPREDAVGLAV
ncbi:uncharacterized protein KY384_003597 [Bacidia gigantensis]|uniref:uncharacterized protein n=1 Tax=Bacidia gigantensis TaxID=2732470 RepID=UPI001D03C79B|nr:uncharacterized protein KY384_003597 [Bacidia gigantensis]KAG8531961.1 hypothetical protein KY384_003597 [Bacidia gigantensis]